jgi:dipeptidyl aminopeptidase/acylaminoacyl peptidase
MRDALRKANRHVELLVIDGGDHRFKSEQSKQAWSAATKFFSMYLGARE